ncbi:glucosyltransferase domain-containing protein [Rosenbergiella nectarea]|uniref:glucosyltransferase domain-containing protein n=2 Tax=Rosenbergiella nectarea TaxID=988801 RepID=UPI001F4EDE61|nr:glucosyltransferase domain-containing protein [Rosenbergiella nectarea]
MLCTNHLKIGKQFFILGLVYILPIILANIYYYDDYGRALLGYTHWYTTDGRPAAELLMRVFLQSRNMYDIFPLPIISGLLLLTFAFLLFIKFLNINDAKFLVVGLSILANPYFIEPLSYRFDSLIFLASISFSLFFIYPAAKKIRFFFGVICTVIVLALYQTSFNVLLCIATIPIYFEAKNNRNYNEVIKKLLSTLAELTTGLTVYVVWEKIIMKTITNDYHPSTITGSVVVKILSNFESYIIFVYNNTPNIILYIAVLYLLSVYSSFELMKRVKTCSILEKISIKLLAFFLPTMSLGCIVGILSVLDKALLFPRSLIGLCGFFIFSTTVWYLSLKNKYYILFISIPILSSLLVVYSYANAYKAQYETYKNIANEIKFDTKEYGNNTLYYQFNGTVEKSELMDNTEKKYRLISILVPGEFYNGWWANMFLVKMDWHQKPNWYSKDDSNNDINNIICNSILLTKNKNYNLYKNGDVLTIDFSKEICKK